MNYQKINISLTLRAPILSQAVGAMEFGLDSVTLKHNGKPVLAGSLVKGNIRHALQYFSSVLDDEHLLSQTDIDRWFGKASEAGSMEPSRGALNFCYFFTLKEADEENPQDSEQKSKDKQAQASYPLRHKIKISKDTGVVDKGQLQIIESVFETGEKVEFEGQIFGWMDDGDAEKLCRWLKKALDYIDAMGASKSSGFGRLIGFKVSHDTQKHRYRSNIARALSARNGGKRIGVAITPDRPFCIAKPHSPDSNRFETYEYIAGNVLKGAIAKQIGWLFPDVDLASQLADCGFNEWIVTHAVPSYSNHLKRAEPLPLSLACANSKAELVVQDLALQAEPDLLMGDIPRFSIDWKSSDWEGVARFIEKNPKGALDLPPPEVKKRLDVRTQIGDHRSDTPGQAEESQLFSLEAVEPDDFRWCADIDLGAVASEKQEYACRVLEAVLNYPLIGVGKTKAVLHFDVSAGGFKQVELHERLQNRLTEGGVSAHDEPFVVKLNSYARLLPTDLGKMPLTNGHDQLMQHYRDYWTMVSGGQLTLIHFYASQSKQGGRYYFDQFLKGEDYPYAPELLTEPGSVFVLTMQEGADTDKLETLLTRWLRYGLPPQAERFTDDWRRSPWLPENGFGEISIYYPDAAGAK